LLKRLTRQTCAHCDLVLWLATFLATSGFGLATFGVGGNFSGNFLVWLAGMYRLDGRFSLLGEVVIAKQLEALKGSTHSSTVPNQPMRGGGVCKPQGVEIGLNLNCA
jgi:hypothetical protein